MEINQEDFIEAETFGEFLFFLLLGFNGVYNHDSEAEIEHPAHIIDAKEVMRDEVGGEIEC